MVKAITISLLILACSFKSFSQETKRDSSKANFEFQIPYSLNSPVGDLSNRFGIHSELGLNLNIEKGKFHITNSFNYIFGGNVKDSLLFDQIANSQFEIITSENIFGEVLVYQRGFNFFSGLAYSIWENEYLSLRLQGQIGYLNYRTRIEVTNNDVPQLSKDYVRGYDDMMHGLAFREFVGLYYTGDRSLSNFFLGVQFTHSNTRSVRDYSYRSFGEYSLQSKDFYWGIQAGWIIKVGNRTTDKYYF